MSIQTIKVGEHFASIVSESDGDSLRLSTPLALSCGLVRGERFHRGPPGVFPVSPDDALDTPRKVARAKFRLKVLKLADEHECTFITTDLHVRTADEQGERRSEVVCVVTLDSDIQWWPALASSPKDVAHALASMLVAPPTVEPTREELESAVSELRERLRRMPADGQQAMAASKGEPSFEEVLAACTLDELLLEHSPAELLHLTSALNLALGQREHEGIMEATADIIIGKSSAAHTVPPIAAPRAGRPPAKVETTSEPVVIGKSSATHTVPPIAAPRSSRRKPSIRPPAQ